MLSKYMLRLKVDFVHLISCFNVLEILAKPRVSLMVPNCAPRNSPPPFSSPLFPTPMRIPGSNGAITRATLEVKTSKYSLSLCILLYLYPQMAFAKVRIQWVLFTLVLIERGSNNPVMKYLLVLQSFSSQWEQIWRNFATRAKLKKSLANL